MSLATPPPPTVVPSPKSSLSASDIDTLILMDDVMHKLNILNYLKDFCKEKDYKPIGRPYFAYGGKPSEKFPYFCGLAGWLLTEIDHNFSEWTDVVDANAVANNILLEVQKAGFLPSKASEVAEPTAEDIRQGSGIVVCQILDFLTTKVLQYRGFRIEPPVYPQHPSENEEIISSESDGDEIDEELTEEEEEESEIDCDDNDGFDDEKSCCSTKDASTRSVESGMTVPLENTILLGFETDSVDWGNRLSAAKYHGDQLDSLLTSICPKLVVLCKEISEKLPIVTKQWKEGFEESVSKYEQKQADFIRRTKER